MIPTNSENEGTVFNLSLKYVGRRREGGSGSEASVAKDLAVEMKPRDAWRRGGAFKHLNLVAAAAIFMKASSQGVVDDEVVEVTITL